jgi:leader peptidase (prepilin peptidase)/N-methyltransferase
MPDWMLDFSLFGMPFHFWTAVFALVGAMTGSFLNVCIHRMPREESIWSPPSHCPQCGSKIPLWRNVPIVSWALLRGRCADCGVRISPRYLAVEVVTSLAFAGCWLFFGRDNPSLAIATCPLVAILIGASVIDIEHFIIPDPFTLGGAFIGFVASALAPALHNASSATDGMKLSFVGMAAGAGLVYLILRVGKWLFGRQYVEFEPRSRLVFHEDGLLLPDRPLSFEEVFYRKSDVIAIQASQVELPDRCYSSTEVRLSPRRLQIGDERMDPKDVPYMEVVCDRATFPREAMGLGDVKFMACIGSFLGWQSVLFSLFVSSIVGALIGVGLIAIGKREWSSRLPYGPYIALAAALWIFGGQHLWARFLAR